MLKQRMRLASDDIEIQPPLGGCVLKPDKYQLKATSDYPAAFRRLCVETILPQSSNQAQQPAAFRRLCVETLVLDEPLARLTPSRL